MTLVQQLGIRSWPISTLAGDTEAHWPGYPTITMNIPSVITLWMDSLFGDQVCFLDLREAIKKHIIAFCLIPILSERTITT